MVIFSDVLSYMWSLLVMYAIFRDVLSDVQNLCQSYIFDTHIRRIG